MLVFAKSEIFSTDLLGGKGGTIGGSLVAAILNQSPFGDEVSAYAELVHGSEKKETEAMRRGTLFEHWLRPIAGEAIGENVTVQKPLMTSIVHRDHSVLHGSMDGIAVDRETGRHVGMVEIKTTSIRAPGWGEVDPPFHYWLQVQHYLFVCGYSVGWLYAFQADDAVFAGIERAVNLARFDADESHEFAVDLCRAAIVHGDAKIHVYKIEACESYRDEIVPHLLKWHETHVESGVEPDLTGSAHWRRVTAGKFSHSDPERIVDLSDPIVGDVVELKRLKAEKGKAVKAVESEYDEKIDALELRITEAIGDAAAVTLYEPIPDGSRRKKPRRLVSAKVTVKSNAGRLQAKRLREAEPEIYERFCGKRYETRTLTTSVMKGFELPAESSE